MFVQILSELATENTKIIAFNKIINVEDYWSSNNYPIYKLYIFHSYGIIFLNR